MALVDMTERHTAGSESGLADPTDARSNCGVGVVMDLDGGNSHRVVQDGLELVECMEHRGTTGAEKNTGDGAGIMLQIPHEFFADEVDADLPAAGEYAVGSLFLPQDDDERAWVREELADLFADHTRAEWEDRLGAIDDAMFGLVNTPAEAVEDPHLRERGIFAETDAGHRRVRFPARTEAAGDDAGDAGSTGTLPTLGEHTDELLAECGFDADEIARLREENVV